MRSIYPRARFSTLTIILSLPRTGSISIVVLVLFVTRAEDASGTTVGIRERTASAPVLVTMVTRAENTSEVTIVALEERGVPPTTPLSCS